MLIRFLFIAIFCALSIPLNSGAYTANDGAKTATSDGSYSDTQNAVNYIDAKNQDDWILTVGSPDGEYSWNSQLEISIEHIFTLQGAGTYATRPTITITHGGYSGIDLNTTSGKTNRVSNFIFEQSSGVDHMISIWGYGEDNFRVDHCQFVNLGWGNVGIKILDANQNNSGQLGPYGLIDNNVFTGSGPFNGVYVFQGADTPSWTSAHTWGAKQAVYIEDNTFTNTGTGDFGGAPAVDAAYGARFVFRHNTLSNYGIVWHGNCSAGVGNSTLQVEILHNTISTSVAADFAVFARGGTAYIYDNTITTTGGGSWNSGVKLDHYRARSNSDCSYDCFSWPCSQQVGRGVVGSSEGAVPAYIYGNTISGASAQINPVVSVIEEDRDYYTTAKPGYTEYTYPHPLTGESEDDETAPIVTAFTIPSTSTSLTVSITTFTASDAVGVTGYLVNESATTPSVSDENWSASAQSSYTFSTEGSKTLYAWAKDAAGNISTSEDATVTITVEDEEPAALPTGNGLAAAYAYDSGITAHSSVLFFDGFEDYTANSELTSSGNWDSYYQSANLLLDTSTPYSGSKSLRMRLPITGSEVSNAVVKSISPEQDTVFVRAYTKFSAGYAVNTNSNHNGIRLSSNYPGPGTVPDGTDFFMGMVQNTINYSESSPGYTNAYIYHPEQRSQWGDHWYPDGKVLPYDLTPGDFGDYFVERNNVIPSVDTWYSYEFMIQANTPGARDGRVAVWIDGVLIADWQNVRLRDTTSLKIDEIQLELHSQSSAQINYKWYDNVVVATEYIGPMVTSVESVSSATGVHLIGVDGP